MFVCGPPSRFSGKLLSCARASLATDGCFSINAVVVLDFGLLKDSYTIDATKCGWVFVQQRALLAGECRAEKNSRLHDSIKSMCFFHRAQDVRTHLRRLPHVGHIRTLTVSGKAVRSTSDSLGQRPIVRMFLTERSALVL